MEVFISAHLRSDPFTRDAYEEAIETALGDDGRVTGGGGFLDDGIDVIDIDVEIFDRAGSDADALVHRLVLALREAGLEGDTELSFWPVSKTIRLGAWTGSLAGTPRVETP